MKRRTAGNDVGGSLRPIRRVLVPTDFSPSSDCALERAVLIAGSGHGNIDLLHVGRARLQSAERQKARRNLERAVLLAREFGGKAGAPVVRLSAGIRTGEPHVEIIRRAREINAEIVVMGRGRPGGLVRSMLGTTSARVVRMSDVATLVVGRRPRAPYRRPLIAIETDPSVRSLIELTRRVVHGAEGRVRLVHAYQVPFEEYHLVAGDASSRWYFHQSRKSAEASVRKLLVSIGLDPAAMKCALRRGDPRQAILAEAARIHADLLVLGTHGRGGVAHALLGSIAERVVASTKRDILVARPVRFTFVPP